MTNVNRKAYKGFCHHSRAQQNHAVRNPLSMASNRFSVDLRQSCDRQRTFISVGTCLGVFPVLPSQRYQQRYRRYAVYKKPRDQSFTGRLLDGSASSTSLLYKLIPGYLPKTLTDNMAKADSPRVYAFKHISTIGHAALATIAIIIAFYSKVPYPGLFEELANEQQNIVIAIILLECPVLLTDIFEKSSCIKGRAKVIMWLVYCLCVVSLLLCVSAFLNKFNDIYGNSEYYVVDVYVKIRQTVEELLYEEVTEFYGMPGHAAVTDAINVLQREKQCCGAESYADFFNSSFANLPMYGGRVVPVTCFKIPEDGFVGATTDGIDESKIYIQGCNDALVQLYEDHFIKIRLTVIAGLFTAYDCLFRAWIFRGFQRRKNHGVLILLGCRDKQQNQDQESGSRSPGADEGVKTTASEPFLEPGTSSQY